MADKVTNSNVLTMVAGFADGDDRTITLDNPKGDLDFMTTGVQTLAEFIKENNIILGDKTGAGYSRMKSAKVSTKRVTHLDLG